MSTFDVSRVAQCRHCTGCLVIQTDFTGSGWVHTGTWRVTCPPRQAPGQQAQPMPSLTQADVQLGA